MSQKIRPTCPICFEEMRVAERVWLLGQRVNVFECTRCSNRYDPRDIWGEEETEEPKKEDKSDES